MQLTEAVDEAQRWLRHLHRKRERTCEIQSLATMARNGHAAEAQERLRLIDKSPIVYDAANLELAVRTMIKALGGCED
jgi:hypothetical protein